MAGAVRSFRDLVVWQRSTDLCVHVYQLTAGFPNEEKFGLVAQIRRSVVSVPSNIAEGFGRGGPVEYVRFLRIAKGSLNEVETQLFLASRLGYLNKDCTDSLFAGIFEVGRLLGGLIRSLECHR